MNIAFFLTPKLDVIYENENSTMRKALERMEYHRYTAIPLIDDQGKYVGTLTEGDLLWKIKNTPSLKFNDTNKINLKDVPRYTYNKPAHIDAEIEDLISLSINQNFVPVVDDNYIFIGIIKRSQIINYCYDFIKGKKYNNK
ncbi:CBS domain-containing protein [Clostridium sp. Marseille-Q2269]|uniref:CBS domain-containing protein n=1 Tax=Clostridium sp. Marseille-Q2269 TaxID=2942205 RepID=UPI002072F989|nr:CBS domain-containing protein [Clostridium sp. Marseille-Q2269]